MTAFVQAFAVGFSLILAIGAQNAFVLRQGLRGEHVFLVCLVCAISDALLIVAGVFGFEQIIHQWPWVVPAARWFGALFLFAYGARSLYAASQSGDALAPTNAKPQSLFAALLTCLALTWLNPHVYLDTLFLVGSISTGFPGQEMQFALGATTASFVFFFSLGFGAALLRGFLTSPIVWRYLEAAIGITMWSIAVSLLI